MININLKSLVDRMAPSLRDALEGAAGLSMAQSHYHVELEHWLLKILDNGNSDLEAILDKFDINIPAFARELGAAMDKFKTGSSRPAALSTSLVDAAKYAWMLASVEYGHNAMTSGHLLTAALLDEPLKDQLFSESKTLRCIAPETLREAARALIGAGSELPKISTNSSTQDPDSVSISKTPALDKYTINLTERAQNGEIDPVLGRDEEIRQCIDILTRRRQNNPILTGEAGVGKTAVVEGFALRIAQGDVPEPLKQVTLRTLDLGLLQAGASVKGEFENRLKAVIDEVKSSLKPIILFVDEAHTMIGAGGKEGQGDAANLLKPALARGELRTIAATTWAEYKKYFERDPALTRRFQVVKVEEPSEISAIEMMRGIATSLQAHHKVRILDEAIIASVKLSHRYIPGRQLPDKSVSLLDTACARVALSQSSTPGAIEDCERMIAQAERNLQRITREHAASNAQQDDIDYWAKEKDAATLRLTELQHQFEQEKTIVEEIKSIHNRIDAHFCGKEEDQISKESFAQLQSSLEALTSQLSELQGEMPLMQAAVDEQAIAEVIANWTGIPVGKMISNEIQAVQSIADKLGRRVIGQPHALEAVAQAVRTSRAGLTDPRKPVGVFLFCGTSGVGKTETALALADELFGGEQNITTINMSEFKEEHKVSMLLGSPPGYVGYGEGGVLTEAARRKPYSVILLDEMEKAHPGVQDIFYNLFDKGTIKDGEGRDIDFKNTIIIMTSNAGEDAIRAIFQHTEEKPEPDVLLDNIRPHLLRHFKPAFLGRANVVAYYPLDDEDLMKIAKINLSKIERRVQDHYGASFDYSDDVLLHIVARCQESDTGARNIENILNRTLLPALASECLDKLANGDAIRSLYVDVDSEGDFSYQVK